MSVKQYTYQVFEYDSSKIDLLAYTQQLERQGWEWSPKDDNHDADAMLMSVRSGSRDPNIQGIIMRRPVEQLSNKG